MNGVVAVPLWFGEVLAWRRSLDGWQADAAPLPTMDSWHQACTALAERYAAHTR